MDIAHIWSLTSFIIYMDVQSTYYRENTPHIFKIVLYLCLGQPFCCGIYVSSKSAYNYVTIFLKRTSLEPCLPALLLGWLHAVQLID